MGCKHQSIVWKWSVLPSTQPPTSSPLSCFDGYLTSSVQVVWSWCRGLYITGTLKPCVSLPITSGYLVVLYLLPSFLEAKKKSQRSSQCNVYGLSNNLWKATFRLLFFLSFVTYLRFLPLSVTLRTAEVLWCNAYVSLWQPHPLCLLLCTGARPLCVKITTKRVWEWVCSCDKEIY